MAGTREGGEQASGSTLDSSVKLVATSKSKNQRVNVFFVSEGGGRGGL